jgi:hypothetical protein
MTTHVGRRAHSPYSVSVTVRLPRVLVDAIDAHADSEFCQRAMAIRLLLECGLDTVGKPLARPGRERRT